MALTRGRSAGLQGLLVPVLSLLGPRAAWLVGHVQEEAAVWGLTDAVGAGQLWSLPLQTLVPEWRALSLPSEWVWGTVGRPGKGRWEKHQLPNLAGRKVATEA